MGAGALRRFHGGRDAYLPNLDDRVGEDPRAILDKNHREEYDQPYGAPAAHKLADTERKVKGDEPLDPKEKKRLQKEAKARGDRREPDQTEALDKAASEGNLPDGDRRAPVRPPEELAAEMRAAPSQTLPPNNPDMTADNLPGGPEGGERAAPPGTNPAPGTAAPTTTTTTPGTPVAPAAVPPGTPVAPAAPGTSTVTPPKAPSAPARGGNRSGTGRGRGGSTKK